MPGSIGSPLDRRRLRINRASSLLKTGALQAAIVNSASLSSIATDAQGVIQIFNVGAERMLGYDAADVVDLTTPASLSDAQELIDRAASLGRELGTTIMPGFDALVYKAARGIEDVYELTYVRKDGRRLPALVSVTALRDGADEIIGYLLISTDNTARKHVDDVRAQLERALQQKNAELEGASRLKSEFLANMSHELRTPLNAIIGFSEVLRDGMIGPLSESQRGFVGDIFTSGKHLLGLINDILDLSKVEAGAMALDLEPMDVASLFENSLSVVRERAATRQIRVLIDAGSEVPLFQADGRKMRQIVYNLLSNAVKFTNDGGQVILGARVVPRDQVGRITAGMQGRTFPLASVEFSEFLEIGISDSGIGISTAGMAKLFAPFSQIDSGLARRFEGTGLGLSMVKVLVELHGGTVAVESVEGRGSRFTVWLPLRPGFASSPQTPPYPVLVPRNAVVAPRTALVVEDDDKSAELVRLQLEAQGFNVLRAISAESALAMASQQPLALITLDIMLPNMDGWEFLGRIKQVAALQRIPVVIISVVADRNKGFALGAAAVIEKPVSRQELYESLVDIGLFPITPGGTLKVLIVDDDPRAVELVALRMGGLANVVLRAYGGLEAITIASAELPDLIVLDLMMPDISGFDVVAALAGNPATARIPVLIVTANRLSGEERQNLSGQVAAIMEKGEFSYASFATEVGRALAGRSEVTA